MVKSKQNTMNKLVKLLPLMMAFVLFSCGGEEGGDEGGSVEASAEMKAFIGKFDGNSESVEAALKEYGASEEIADHDMGMYSLSEPVIKAKTDDCYTLECKSGMVKNTYEVCWTDGKISSITGG